MTLEAPGVLEPFSSFGDTQLPLVPAEVADAELLPEPYSGLPVGVPVDDKDPAVAHPGLGDVGGARVVPDAARRPQAPAQVLGVVGAAVECGTDAEAVVGGGVLQGLDHLGGERGDKDLRELGQELIGVSVSSICV